MYWLTPNRVQPIQFALPVLSTPIRAYRVRSHHVRTNRTASCSPRSLASRMVQTPPWFLQSETVWVAGGVTHWCKLHFLVEAAPELQEWGLLFLVGDVLLGVEKKATILGGASQSRGQCSHYPGRLPLWPGSQREGCGVQAVPGVDSPRNLHPRGNEMGLGTWG